MPRSYRRGVSGRSHRAPSLRTACTDRRSKRRRRTRTVRHLPFVQTALFALCAVVFVVCVAHLGGYARDYFRSRRLSAQANAAYQAPTATPQASAAQPEHTATTFPQLAQVKGAVSSLHQRAEEALAHAQRTSQAHEDAEEAQAAANPTATMPPQAYPNNPDRKTGSRFATLLHQNKDVVGFLSIDGLLSEAVVQRDNTYYLRRDYLGYHNANGAIFLDQSCNLSSRPYTLTLYGHNMKTGAMFGCLRNYEDLAFYHKNPFVTFDTIYEEGRYVIFSVAKVSLDPASTAFTEFFSLEGCTVAQREAIISDLKRLSLFTSPIDVAADDQLLLLVTCMGNDDERCIVAARRLRETETDGGLYVQVHAAARK